MTTLSEKENEYDYDTLLQLFQEQCLYLTSGGINSRERLTARINKLLSNDPYFAKLFYAMLDANSEWLINLKLSERITSDDLFKELQAFSQGECIDFTDTNLRRLINHYREDSAFRERCALSPRITEAFVYWQREYHTRLQNTPFAVHSLLFALKMYHENFPDGFDEVECTVIQQLYQTHAEFRYECDTSHHIHTALTRWGGFSSLLPIHSQKNTNE